MKRYAVRFIMTVEVDAETDGATILAAGDFASDIEALANSHANCPDHVYYTDISWDGRESRLARTQPKEPEPEEVDDEDPLYDHDQGET